MPPTVDRELLTHLIRLHQRWRRTLALRGLGRSFIVAVAAIAVAATIDAVFHSGFQVRVALAAAAYLVVVIDAWRHWLPRVIRPFAPERMAWIVENQYPQLNEQLISAVELSGTDQRSISLELIGRVIEESRTNLGDIEPAEAFPISWRQFRLVLGVGLALLVLCAVPPLQLPLRLVRVVSPSPYQASLGRYHLDLRLPGGTQVTEGDRIDVVVSVSHGRPAEAPQLMLQGRQLLPLPLALDDTGRTVYALTAPRDPFLLWVEAGDVKSRTLAVTVRRRPVIEGYRITYTYPPYAGMEPMTVEASNGDLQALRNTVVQLELICNNPLAAATLIAGQTETAAVIAADGLTATVSLKLEKLDQYALMIEDRRGLTNLQPITWSVQIIDDQPPQVVLDSPATDGAVDPEAEVALAWSASDDFRVASQQVIVVSGFGLDRRELPVAADQGEMRLPLNAWRLQTGDEVEVFVEAVDDTGQRGSSDHRRLTVGGGRLLQHVRQFIAQVDEMQTAVRQSQRSLRLAVETCTALESRQAESRGDREHYRRMVNEHRLQLAEQLRQAQGFAAASGRVGFFPDSVLSLDLARRYLAQERLFALTDLAVDQDWRQASARLTGLGESISPLAKELIEKAHHHQAAAMTPILLVRLDAARELAEPLRLRRLLGRTISEGQDLAQHIDPAIATALAELADAAATDAAAVRPLLEQLGAKAAALAADHRQLQELVKTLRSRLTPIGGHLAALAKELSLGRRAEDWALIGALAEEYAQRAASAETPTQHADLLAISEALQTAADQRDAEAVRRLAEAVPVTEQQHNLEAMQTRLAELRRRVETARATSNADNAEAQLVAERARSVADTAAQLMTSANVFDEQGKTPLMKTTANHLNQAQQAAVRASDEAGRGNLANASQQLQAALTQTDESARELQLAAARQLDDTTRSRMQIDELAPQESTRVLAAQAELEALASELHQLRADALSTELEHRLADQADKVQAARDRLQAEAARELLSGDGDIDRATEKMALAQSLTALHAELTEVSGSEDAKSSPAIAAERTERVAAKLESVAALLAAHEQLERDHLPYAEARQRHDEILAALADRLPPEMQRQATALDELRRAETEAGRLEARAKALENRTGDDVTRLDRDAAAARRALALLLDKEASPMIRREIQQTLRQASAEAGNLLREARAAKQLQRDPERRSQLSPATKALAERAEQVEQTIARAAAATELLDEPQPTYAVDYAAAVKPALLRAAQKAAANQDPIADLDQAVTGLQQLQEKLDAAASKVPTQVPVTETMVPPPPPLAGVPADAQLGNYAEQLDGWVAEAQAWDERLDALDSERRAKERRASDLLARVTTNALEPAAVKAVETAREQLPTRTSEQQAVDLETVQRLTAASQPEMAPEFAELATELRDLHARRGRAAELQRQFDDRVKRIQDISQKADQALAPMPQAAARQAQKTLQALRHHSELHDFPAAARNAEAFQETVRDLQPAPDPGPTDPYRPSPTDPFTHNYHSAVDPAAPLADQPPLEPQSTSPVSEPATAAEEPAEADSTTPIDPYLAAAVPQAPDMSQWRPWTPTEVPTAAPPDDVPTAFGVPAAPPTGPPQAPRPLAEVAAELTTRADAAQAQLQAVREHLLAGDPQAATAAAATLAEELAAVEVSRSEGGALNRPAMDQFTTALQPALAAVNPADDAWQNATAAARTARQTEVEAVAAHNQAGELATAARNQAAETARSARTADWQQRSADEQAKALTTAAAAATEDEPLAAAAAAATAAQSPAAAASETAAQAARENQVKADQASAAAAAAAQQRVAAETAARQAAEQAAAAYVQSATQAAEQARVAAAKTAAAAAAAVAAETQAGDAKVKAREAATEAEAALTVARQQATLAANGDAEAAENTPAVQQAAVAAKSAADRVAVAEQAFQPAAEAAAAAAAADAETQQKLAAAEAMVQQATALQSALAETEQLATELAEYAATGTALDAAVGEHQQVAADLTELRQDLNALSTARQALAAAHPAAPLQQLAEQVAKNEQLPDPVRQQAAAIVDTLPAMTPLAQAAAVAKLGVPEATAPELAGEIAAATRARLHDPALHRAEAEQRTQAAELADRAVEQAKVLQPQLSIPARDARNHLQAAADAIKTDDLATAAAELDQAAEQIDDLAPAAPGHRPFTAEAAPAATAAGAMGNAEAVALAERGDYDGAAASMRRLAAALADEQRQGQAERAAQQFDAAVEAQLEALPEPLVAAMAAAEQVGEQLPPAAAGALNSALDVARDRDYAPASAAVQQALQTTPSNQQPVLQNLARQLLAAEDARRDHIARLPEPLRAAYDQVTEMKPFTEGETRDELSAAADAVVDRELSTAAGHLLRAAAHPETPAAIQQHARDLATALDHADVGIYGAMNDEARAATQQLAAPTAEILEAARRQDYERAAALARAAKQEATAKAYEAAAAARDAGLTPLVRTGFAELEDAAAQARPEDRKTLTQARDAALAAEFGDAAAKIVRATGRYTPEVRIAGALDQLAQQDTQRLKPLATALERAGKNDFSGALDALAGAADAEALAATVTAAERAGDAARFLAAKAEAAAQLEAPSVKSALTEARERLAAGDLNTAIQKAQAAGVAGRELLASLQAARDRAAAAQTDLEMGVHRAQMQNDDLQNAIDGALGERIGELRSAIPGVRTRQENAASELQLMQYAADALNANRLQDAINALAHVPGAETALAPLQQAAGMTAPPPLGMVPEVPAAELPNDLIQSDPGAALRQATAAARDAAAAAEDIAQHAHRAADAAAAAATAARTRADAAKAALDAMPAATAPTPAGQRARQAAAQAANRAEQAAVAAAQQAEAASKAAAAASQQAAAAGQAATAAADQATTARAAAELTPAAVQPVQQSAQQAAAAAKQAAAQAQTAQTAGTAGQQASTDAGSQASQVVSAARIAALAPGVQSRAQAATDQTKQLQADHDQLTRARQQLAAERADEARKAVEQAAHGAVPAAAAARAFSRAEQLAAITRQQRANDAVASLPPAEADTPSHLPPEVLYAMAQLQAASHHLADGKADSQTTQALARSREHLAAAAAAAANQLASQLAGDQRNDSLSNGGGQGQPERLEPELPAERSFDGDKWQGVDETLQGSDRQDRQTQYSSYYRKANRRYLQRLAREGSQWQRKD